MSTDVSVFISDLDAGVFENKVRQVLSDVAGAVIAHNAAGQVILKFDLKRIGQSYQIQVQHQVRYTQPTSKGKVVEEDSTSTPMYVGTNGRLTFFPENQDVMFDKLGEIKEQK